MTLALATPRLLLRELEAGDLEVTAALLGDRQVMRYWAALERATGHPIGQAGLMDCDVDGSRELGLGYIIERASWRRGFATEAAAACLAHGRDVLGRRPIALIRPENRPSAGVALELGLHAGRTTL